MAGAFSSAFSSAFDTGGAGSAGSLWWYAVGGGAVFKNVASQKLTVLVIDTAANTPKTGDAANLTAYVSKDDGAVTVLGDTSATELDATNAPGLYSFDLTQGETNADKLLFSGKSSTSGIRVIPLLVYTVPANLTALSIDGSGRVDVAKIAGTAQTARDVGASVLLSSGTGTGQVKLSAGYVAPNWGDVGNPTTTLALTGTTIATTQKVDVETIKTQTVTAAAAVAVNANVGTTQPVNFTGTAGSALVKGDAIDWGGTAVGSAIVRANLIQYAGGGIPSLSVGGYFYCTVHDLDNNAITAASFAAGAIDATAVADGAIDAAAFAAGAITASTIAADAITAAKIAAGAITSSECPALANLDVASSTLATAATATLIKAKTDLIPAAPAAVGDVPTAAANADALLGRNVAGGSSTGRTVSKALFALVNKVTISGGTMTVYSTDDVTSSWTAAVTTTSGADPVTAIDPV